MKGEKKKASSVWAQWENSVSELYRLRIGQCTRFRSSEFRGEYVLVYQYDYAPTTSNHTNYNRSTLWPKKLFSVLRSNRSVHDGRKTALIFIHLIWYVRLVWLVVYGIHTLNRAYNGTMDMSISILAENRARQWILHTQTHNAKWKAIVYSFRKMAEIDENHRIVEYIQKL